MRERLKIVIDQIEPYRDRYALWSMLFIQIGEICFPAKNWRDATSSVLAIWLANGNALLSGTAESALLPFMDGDYALLLKGSCVQCLGPRGTVILTQEIDLRYFCRQLLSAVGKIKKQYSDHTDAPQIRELTTLANKLSKTFAKMYGAPDSN